MRSIDTANHEEAALRLFAAIEGGSLFWSKEIEERGTFTVLDRLLKAGYESSKNSVAHTLNKLSLTSYSKLREEIDSAKGIFITPADLTWPIQLNDLLTIPIGLIIKGEISTAPAISIVGTRNPTQYGIRIANEFGSGFADREWTVVSGGAYGIDSAAHNGALAGEGNTYAVLGSGISVNYPAGNARLFAQIAENGALISEVMPQERARPERFLARNRIIAGLSRGTIVVEAAFRSGSLRTARDAAEIFRVVMAIPGPINSPTSDGCHRLIGERCAEIVTSVNDAMELLQGLA